jgi:hypothetical protein
MCIGYFVYSCKKSDHCARLVHNATGRIAINVFFQLLVYLVHLLGMLELRHRLGCFKEMPRLDMYKITMKLVSIVCVHIAPVYLSDRFDLVFKEGTTSRLLSTTTADTRYHTPPTHIWIVPPDISTAVL